MTPEQVQGLVRGELSRRARGSHAALLVASLAMATMVLSVWLTEAGLPTRTHVAFALVVFIALTWAGHATWVLTHRAVLLVPHQVQAARLAMVCCLAFVTGCVAAWAVVGGPATVMATLTSIVMFAVAAINVRRARARHTALLHRRAELLSSSDRHSSDRHSSDRHSSDRHSSEPSGFSPTVSAGLKPGCSEDSETSATSASKDPK